MKTTSTIIILGAALAVALFTPETATAIPAPIPWDVNMDGETPDYGYVLNWGRTRGVYKASAVCKDWENEGPRPCGKDIRVFCTFRISYRETSDYVNDCGYSDPKITYKFVFREFTPGVARSRIIYTHRGEQFLRYNENYFSGYVGCYENPKRTEPVFDSFEGGTATSKTKLWTFMLVPYDCATGKTFELPDDSGFPPDTALVFQIDQAARKIK